MTSSANTAPLMDANIDPQIAAYLESLVDRKLEERFAGIDQQLAELTERVGSVEEDAIAQRATLVVFSGDFDRLMAAFIIGTGAVAMGLEVSMFFTFWGLTALKKQTLLSGKTLPEKMVSMMLPGGAASVGTSRMNMMGMGPAFFKLLMKRNNVQTLPELIDLAREMEVRMVACQMSMGVMGIKEEELIDGIEYGGVATYLGDSTDSRLTLFI